MFEYDVGIIGGGLAGNLLARQLRRSLPHLSVGLFEKSPRPSFKVGESLVEIASNYFIRRLGLSAYLYDRQLPKNGLRFFFDTPEKDCDLPHMSEIGSVALPYHPSFQIDRARLEKDLLRLNRNDGVELHCAARIRDLKLDDLGTPPRRHRFKVTTSAGTHDAQCRWLIDASGRSSLVARQRNLRVSEPNHALGAVWGRFRHVEDWDNFGPESFRSRIRYSSRMLSTNHFCYPGYWIWFIRLSRGVTSVGVVCEKNIYEKDQLGKKNNFVNFLGRHRAVQSLLRKAEMVDVGGYSQLAYNTREYFSRHRWGLTGEAAVFSDPFYSPGSDFIALENDFLTDLIARDDAGAGTEELEKMADLYNRYLAFRFEATMLLYRGLYQALGSFELFKVKWQLDFALYYHLWLSQYQQDLHLNSNFLREQLDNQTFTLNALSNFADFFRTIAHVLKDRGVYFRKNVGKFADGLEGIHFVTEVGQPQPVHKELRRLHEILNDVYRKGVDLIPDRRNCFAERRSLSELTTRRPLL